MPLAVYFKVLGLLYASGPWFGTREPAGATSTVQVANENGSEGGMIPIGPLQLSIEGASGLPKVDYPPFIIVAGERR